jgi:hypothetical protein
MYTRTRASQLSGSLFEVMIAGLELPEAGDHSRRRYILAGVEIRGSSRQDWRVSNIEELVIPYIESHLCYSTATAA